MTKLLGSARSKQQPPTGRALRRCATAINQSRAARLSSYVSYTIIIREGLRRKTEEIGEKGKKNISSGERVTITTREQCYVIGISTRKSNLSFSHNFFFLCFSKSSHLSCLFTTLFNIFHLFSSSLSLSLSTCIESQAGELPCKIARARIHTDKVNDRHTQSSWPGDDVNTGSSQVTNIDFWIDECHFFCF